MKINEIISEAVKQRIDPKCWKGKHKEGTKIKGGVRVNNCVPNEGLNEFAPPGSSDGGNDGFSEETLKRLAAQWWNGDEDPRVEQTLMSAGWEIGQDEGYDNGGAFVVQAGDINGNSYISWPAEELEQGLLESKQRCMQCGMTNCKCAPGKCKCKPVAGWIPNKGFKKAIAEGLTLDQQFDIIEEMVEQLALEHGVDADTIWEDFDTVDDNELFESAAWRRKEGKSKKGGLNAKGVASYRRENPGSKLQTAVTTKPSKLKKGSKAANRRKSFCARMGGVKGPMEKNGKPTRKALALRKWNC